MTLALLFALLSAAQRDRFYSPSDGLSGSAFHSIYQDSRGYLWVSIFSGLNRFDGYQFAIYEHKAEDTTSISSTYTNLVYEDRSGSLWVGTNKGLDRFDYDRDCFHRVYFRLPSGEIQPDVKSILETGDSSLWLVTSHGLILFRPETGHYEFHNHQFKSDGTPEYSTYNQAIRDESGNLWIATNADGVLIFDTSRKQFMDIQSYTGTAYQFPDRTVNTVYRTDDGIILFGTQRNGLIVYDPSKKLFYKAAGLENPEFDRGFYNIISDRKGTIWIGTQGGGLKKFNTSAGRVEDASGLINLPGISRSGIICYEDRQGDMWFGIRERGLYLKVLSSKAFQTLGSPGYINEPLSHYGISSVLTDKSGHLWIGSEGGGLHLLRKGSASFEVFSSAPNGISIQDRSVTKLYEDSRGNIWIGTYLAGLYCYQAGRYSLKHYVMPGFDRELWGNYIFDLEEDNLGNLLIATNGGGLFYLDHSVDTIADVTHFESGGKPCSIPSKIYSLEFDADNGLWIGTENGLIYRHQLKDRFRSFTVSSGDLSNDLVTCVRRDRLGVMWIGTLSGLYRFDPASDSLIRYSTENGLCNNSIKAIEADDRNTLWISTTAGISRFETSTGQFRNYFFYDGLPCDKYMIGASHADNKGNIWFGGVDGLVWFHPDSIKVNNQIPRLIFTSFKIFNTEMNVDPFSPGSILKKDIDRTDTLFVDFSQKSFTLEFATISFSTPEKIRYAVQLEGFSPKWDYKDYRHRYATYTNLSPGTYTFRVRTTDFEGLWSGHERMLTIIVKPPFWRTGWAFLFYALLLVIAGYYIRKIMLDRINLRNQLHFEHLERVRVEEFNQSKMRFFANISHEIRTPLSLMLAPLTRLVNSPLTDTQKRMAGFLYRNTLRLERIINQLLELQKLENTELVLKARRMNVTEFIREIIALFDQWAAEKNIHLSFEPEADELYAWIDPEKMDKIIFNLLSNAIKFTPENGLVSIILTAEGNNTREGWLSISVMDTGKGISKAYTERIFERFYQVEEEQINRSSGTGIGLHLVYELVRIHHGDIQVLSEPGKGSTFTVKIPLGDHHFLPEEKDGTDLFPGSYHHVVVPGQIQTELRDTETGTGIPGHKTVLIVEDDPEIMQFLAEDLGNTYRILKAADGNEGWETAFLHIPDLIISDIVMPGMNGIDLCKKVKNSLETSHIPVVLLTAKTLVEQEIEGLESGADEYIRKPFHPQLLRLKIGKILESRELLPKRFLSGTGFGAHDWVVTSADERFLQKAVDFVRENISNAELNMEKMSSAMNISRVHLYRKLKALVNQNPTEFIRTIRLKQAAHLLSQGKLNVSEVAWMVGFNSHQYFTNSFQKYFNMSPTEYGKRYSAAAEKTE